MGAGFGCGALFGLGLGLDLGLGLVDLQVPEGPRRVQKRVRRIVWKIPFFGGGWASGVPVAVSG